MMFRLSLTQRIWFSFILLIIVIGAIIAVIYPLSIQQTLKEDSFEIIEQEQIRYILPNLGNDIPKSNTSFIESQAAARSVGHLLLVNQQGQLQGDPVPDKVLQKMGSNAYKQKGEIGRYQLSYQGTTLFYVVRKIHVKSNQVGSNKGTTGFLISYMWDTYRKEMVRKLWWRLLLILVVAIIASLFFSAWLARYLKQPLNALGKRFEEISKLNWREPFEWSSGDEFQLLAAQFEDMRQNLLRYDESQKTFIQQASHELKTPLMIIQSYAQAAKDGLHPQGDLEGTMDVIISETGQMEKRVRKLLYYAKVDSLRDQKPQIDRINFSELALPLKERFSLANPHIDIQIEGGQIPLELDIEQFETLFENLIENSLRYAKNYILLKAERDLSEMRLIVENDGEPISEETLEILFKPFHKGKRGQFGLGLAIVRTIVERHQGRIEVQNSNQGVKFIIHLSLDRK